MTAGGRWPLRARAWARGKATLPNQPERPAEDESVLDTDVDFRSITTFSQLPRHFGVNQHIPIDDELKENLRRTLWLFRAPIRYAFAYGSGVFSQGALYKSGAVQKPQIDLIFGVTHTEDWHARNMQQHPAHYSFLRRLGSGAVGYVQDLGAGVYFNPYVELNGLVIKYGVVNLDVLCDDLVSWNTLYVSGRLHKPVKILRDSPRVRLANQRNLISALRTALLLLPERFTEYELYHTIASLSYMGDPRMQLGENPRKVHNIVTNQMDNFSNLYVSLINSLPNISVLSAAGGGDPLSSAKLVQDMDPARRSNMVARLPVAFRDRLYARYENGHGVRRPTAPPQAGKVVGNEFDRGIATSDHLRDEISTAIRETVQWPSTVQSAKGLLTAGLTKGFRYASEKLQKKRAQSA
ncbi:mitochondrial matrix Mmp37 [Dipodascopsis tothii]|uniref:mitochondrial matrix Mmp37 n=1 Tax=Dipodascopsis tothii TaxID=44089 RepID=UPI0034CF08AD